MSLEDSAGMISGVVIGRDGCVLHRLALSRLPPVSGSLAEQICRGVLLWGALAH